MKLTKIGLYFLAFSIVIVACKKDSETENGNEPNPKEPKENTVKYDGLTFELESGFLEYFGTFGSSAYNIDMTLYGGGLEFYFAQNGLDSVAGTGHFMTLEIFTDDSTKIAPGTYNLVGSNSAGNITNGHFTFNYVAGSPTSGIEILFQNGTVEVSYEEMNIIVEMSATTHDNENFNAYFKGPIDLYQGKLMPNTSSLEIQEKAMYSH